MKILISTLLIFCVISCKSPEKKVDHVQPVHIPNPTALKLNAKAVRIFGEAPYLDSLQKNILYDSAIGYLNQGIKLDSQLLPLYTNKSKALLRTGMLGDAIKCLDTAILVKPDFGEAIMTQGFLYEKKLQIDSAQHKYDLALKIFIQRLEREPGNVSVMSNIAFVYAFVENQDRAKDEIQDYILRNPKSSELKIMEKAINDFDRDKFIHDLE